MNNVQCLDIGKDAVEEAHQAAFGYGMAVDPRHGGTYVRKSVDNATHDALVFEGPSEPEPGYVYQRLIQNGFAGLDEEMAFPHRLLLPVCPRTEGAGAEVQRDARSRRNPRAGWGDFHAFANAVPLELMITREEMTLIDGSRRRSGSTTANSTF